MISSNSNDPSADLLIERNSEKQAVSEASLSTVQQEAAEELLEQLSQDGLYNLVGPPESGKTFLAWYLTITNDDWTYFAWLPVKSAIQASVVVVDNTTASRTASRRAREVKAFTEGDSVVVLSETAIPEATGYVHLPDRK